MLNVVCDDVHDKKRALKDNKLDNISEAEGLTV
jgi:hypothetical protein